MTEANPYAAPAAPLDAPPVVEDTASAAFFVVSPLKLALMSFATFNLYFVYWFYRNWSQLRRGDATAGRPSAAVRSFFFIFFTHDLFRRVANAGIERGLFRPASSRKSLATAFVLLLIFGNVLGRLTSYGVLLGPLQIAPLYVLQQDINKIMAHDHPEADGNASFSAGNIAVLLIGSVLWLLVVIGLTLPPP